MVRNVAETSSDGLLDEMTRPTDWPLCSKKCYNIAYPDATNDGIPPGSESDCDPICRWP